MANRKPTNIRDHKRRPLRRRSRTLAAAVKAPARRSQLAGVKASRADQSAFRRDAILAAALEEFSARGFAAARLEDVAQRAGVGKGTIYLHFRDKEALFQELVTSMLGPFVANLEATPPTGLPIRFVLQRLVDVFLREIYGTERRKLIRLVMTEGPRFPQLAEFHYENVVKRAITAMRALLTAAHARGELRNDALVRFPQLVVAPAMMSIIWSGLFDRFATARRCRADGGPSRSDLGHGFEHRRSVMTMRLLRKALIAGLAALAGGLAACTEQGPPTYQGWVEAYLIFVGPDEAGRVEVLNAREGDRIEAGAPLFSVDVDLQRADVMHERGDGEERAARLRARHEARQERRRHRADAGGGGSGAAHRAGAPQFGADPARPPQAPEPGRWHRPAGLLPPRRDGGGRPADRGAAAARQPAGPLLCAGGRSCRSSPMATWSRSSCDGCAADLTARITFIASTAEFTPPVIYSREERAKLVFLVEAAAGEAAGVPRRPAARRRDGGAEAHRGGQAMSARDVRTARDGHTRRRPPRRHRHRGRGPHQVLRRPRRGAQSHHAGAARPDLRLPRPQRLGQDHHHPHAVRPPHARLRARHLPRLRHPRPSPTRSSAMSAT